MTPLRQLIESVEAGVWHGDTTDIFILETHIDAFNAFNGSLDAALALHEALLDSGFHAEIWASVTRPHAWVVHGEDRHDGEEQETEARSWLLAILRAYEAQQEGEE